MKSIALVFSVVLNVLLSVLLLYVALQGCAEVADGKTGVLARDIKVGTFGAKATLFTLPKGLVVRDASASGADWFEPHRFRIVVTSEDAALVAYDKQPPPSSKQDSEFYSAEVGK